MAAKNPQTKLFTPLQIRGLTLRNRIIVAPMGMYSSTDGHFTDFHLMQHGHFTFRGAGMSIIECTAVTATGRTSTLDAGLYDDSHIPGLKKIVDYVHSQEGGGGRIAIQLGHGGRKTSMTPIYPGREHHIASKEEGGWADEVVGPSPVPFLPGYVVPKEITVEQIQEVVDAFGAAAARAVKAGIDAIEVHAAHGYLISSFLSPGSNFRTDAYGGSFENRIRILLETVHSIRSNIPDSMPLFIRISAVDWMEHQPETSQWTIQDSMKLSLILSNIGVDVIDVSSGGNNAEQKINPTTYYQINLADAISKALKDAGKSALVAAVGSIDNAALAKEVLDDEKADMVLVAREFMRNPNLVYAWADELNEDVEWPRQYIR
ncbi:FMN-linked oxidoreductase, partial [Periconia macrospinosa]